MASLQPPSAKKKPSKKPSAMSKADPVRTKNLQLKLSASLHHEIKSYALENHMSIKDLFEAMYAEYRKKHG